jgi:hypothetical protein
LWHQPTPDDRAERRESRVCHCGGSQSACSTMHGQRPPAAAITRKERDVGREGGDKVYRWMVLGCWLLLGCWRQSLGG